MLPLVTLPKEAHIKGQKTGDLIIKYHTVINYDGLTTWLINAIVNGYWKIILPQMLSQGFHIKAVINEMIRDILNGQDIAWMVCWFSGTGYTKEQRVKFIAATKTRKIRVESANKIGTCKTWNQLLTVLSPSMDFAEDMIQRIKKGAITD